MYEKYEKEQITLFVGFDPREAAVYHVFCQSVIDYTTVPVKFIPLHSNMLNNFDGQQDGTNAFIFSRYLVPYLMDYEGWAIFCDGDQLCNDDLLKLWDLRDEGKAVQVVQHDYKTCSPRKYIGSPIENDNINYDRKNWSSVMLFNCSHPANKFLNRKTVAEAGAKFLHRFQWLNDNEIGELPIEWNWLDTEYPENSGAKLHHHTLGAPGFKTYADCDSAAAWHRTLIRSLTMIGEDATEMVRRATWKGIDGTNNELLNAANGGSRLPSKERPDQLRT